LPFLIVALIVTLLLVAAGWHFSGQVVRPRLFGYGMTCRVRRPILYYTYVQSL
jgi:hypothetical protein